MTVQIAVLPGRQNETAQKMRELGFKEVLELVSEQTVPESGESRTKVAIVVALGEKEQIQELARFFEERDLWLSERLRRYQMVCW